MGFWTNYAKTKTIEHITGISAWNPLGFWLGFSTTTPTVSGSNLTEPIGGSYSRVALSSLSLISVGEVKNSTMIESPQSTDNWGTLSYVVIFDHPTSGNLIWYDELNPSRNVISGTTLKIPESNLIIKIN